MNKFCAVDPVHWSWRFVFVGTQNEAIRDTQPRRVIHSIAGTTDAIGSALSKPHASCGESRENHDDHEVENGSMVGDGPRNSKHPDSTA
jgi:hypothetical protein